MGDSFCSFVGDACDSLDNIDSLDFRHWRSSFNLSVLVILFVTCSGGSILSNIGLLGK